MKLLFILSFLTVTNSYAVTPCAPHPGKAYPWEGTGACNGNLQLEIPLPTMDMQLIYNSVDTSGNYGFGNVGWRLSVDDRLIDKSTTENVVLLEGGDGRPTPFYRMQDGSWMAQLNAISPSKLFFLNERWVEYPDNKSRIEYAPSTAGWAATAYIGSGGKTLTVQRDATTNNIVKIVDMYNRNIEFTYSGGHIVSAHDIAGGVYEFRYEYNKLIQITFPNKTGWSIGYWDDLPKNSELVKGLIDPSGSAATFYYASNYSPPPLANCNQGGPYLGSGPVGQVCLSVTSPNNYWTVYSYDQNSVNVKNETDFYTERFNENHVLTESSENGFVTKYVPNTMGLPAIITNYLNQSTALAYDNRGRVISVTDAAGRVSTKNFDASGKLVKWKTGNLTTEVEYDTKGYIKKAVLPGGKVLTITNDSAGNITELKENNIRQFSASYDENGQMLSKTDSAGLVSNFGYDDGYLTSYSNEMGGSAEFRTNVFGQVTRASYSGGAVETSSYDSMGNPESFELANGGHSLGLNFSRKGSGLEGQRTIAKETKEAAGIVSFAINAFNRLTEKLRAAETESSTTPPADAVASPSSTAAESILVMQDGRPLAQYLREFDPAKNSSSIKIGNDTVKLMKCTSADKPVIYLYPKVSSDVTVRLSFDGQIVATYPSYDETLKGWKVRAEPDGTLHDSRDGKEYSYLFWEGAATTPFDMNTREGFVVEGKNSRGFLQEKLSQMGLTPKEYNEFIVYWYPKLAANKWNYVYFAGKDYSDRARLEITPKPDSILRVFMEFKAIESPDEMKISEQKLKKFVRKGFTVVEWGGTEIKSKTETLTQNTSTRVE